MKYITKQTNFKSNKIPYPTYKNSYVRDGKIEIGEKAEYLKINYLFCHVVDNQEIIISKESDLIFTLNHTPTMLKIGEEMGQYEDIDGNMVDGMVDIEMEVYEAIITGEGYSKDKVKTWGKPSLDRVILMIDFESFFNGETGVKLNDLTEVSINGNMIPLNPTQTADIKQLMVDWIENAVIIENEKLGVNFKIETT